MWCHPFTTIAYLRWRNSRVTSISGVCFGNWNGKSDERLALPVLRTFPSDAPWITRPILRKRTKNCWEMYVVKPGAFIGLFATKFNLLLICSWISWIIFPLIYEFIQLVYQNWCRLSLRGDGIECPHVPFYQAPPFSSSAKLWLISIYYRQPPQPVYQSLWLACETVQPKLDNPALCGILDLIIQHFPAKCRIFRPCPYALAECHRGKASHMLTGFQGRLNEEWSVTSGGISHLARNELIAWSAIA